MVLRDDRRHVPTRLLVIRIAVTVTFVVTGHVLLVPAGRPAPEVQGTRREQPPAHALVARAPRHAVRPGRARAGGEPLRVQHLPRARADQGPSAHAADAGARDGRRQRVAAGNRRTARPRAAVPPGPADRGCLARAGVRGADAASRTAGRPRRAGAHATVPVGRDGRAPVRLRRRDHRGAVGPGRLLRAARGHHHRAVGPRADLQPRPDGRRRRAPRRRQQPGPRDRGHGRASAERGDAVDADHRR